MNQTIWTIAIYIKKGRNKYADTKITYEPLGTFALLPAAGTSRWHLIDWIWLRCPYAHPVWISFCASSQIIHAFWKSATIRAACSTPWNVKTVLIKISMSQLVKSIVVQLRVFCSLMIACSLCTRMQQCSTQFPTISH